VSFCVTCRVTVCTNFCYATLSKATHEMHTETVRVYVRYCCVPVMCKKMRTFRIHIGQLELQTETDVHTDINKL